DPLRCAASQAHRARARRDGHGGAARGGAAAHLAGGVDARPGPAQQPRGLDGQGEGRARRDQHHAEGGRAARTARLFARAAGREVDARREDQRHLRGHAADQPAHRRAAHPRLLLGRAAVAVVLDPGPLLGRLPDWREFLTLAELAASSAALAAEFPALVVGVPHPNEPIGTLTLEFLCRLLCEDADVRARLDATLYVIKVADPDGLVLNEGWLKGAFSPARYALHFYRPPHREQVEWGFPVDYKTLRFPKPTPEAAAVMRAMERA